jgi:hypothetical protein
MTPGRLNAALALVALALALVGFAWEDRIPWSEGYGFDGRTYGDIAEDFPGAIFGDAGVAPPGYGPVEDEPEGVDAYYVRRIFPSAVVWATLRVLSVEAQPANVVTAFAAWNVVLIVLVALLWCLAADRLRIGPRGKLLGFTALVVNFLVLKHIAYWPVSTDLWGYAFGAAALYFWLRESTTGLVATTVLGAFTWPTHLIVGVLLLAFPPQRASLLGEPGRTTRGQAYVAGAAAFLFFLFLWMYELAEGPDWELRRSFPLSAVVAAAFVFASVLWLVPDLDLRELRTLARRVLDRRLALAALVFVGVVTAQTLIAARPSSVSGFDSTTTSLWWTTIYPGHFATAAIGWFGPFLLLAALAWRRTCELVRSYGPGLTLVLATFLLGVLSTEPRKAQNAFPLLVPFLVIVAIERWSWRPRLLVAFALVSLAASRIWLPIGDIPYERTGQVLKEFPAQRYFMASGPWISLEMYLVHIAAVTAVGVGLWLALRPRRA